MIYAGTRGYLDDVPINDVQAWEARFLQFIRDRKAEILSTILESGAMDEELEAEVVSAIEQFKSIDSPATDPVAADESESEDEGATDQQEEAAEEAAAAEDA